jgi:hypothetical protein
VCGKTVDINNMRRIINILKGSNGKFTIQGQRNTDFIKSMDTLAQKELKK